MSLFLHHYLYALNRALFISTRCRKSVRGSWHVSVNALNRALSISTKMISSAMAECGCVNALNRALSISTLYRT